MESGPAQTLSEYPASTATRRLALLVIVASLVMFLVLVPIAGQPMEPASWFIPLHQPVLAVNDLITATLLAGYFRLTRKYAILVLGCGYLYSALMSVVHMLSFPGVFAPGGLLGAGSQGTGYLHAFWHAGFPIAVIAYALLKDGRRETRSLGRETATALLVTLAVAAALTALATLGSDWLPQMLEDGHYSSVFNIGRFGTWGITALALAVLFTRRSTSTLDLWLIVVLCACFFEIGLVSIFNTGRWDVGFYAGRIYAVFASSLVLIMLLSEHVRMYRDLAAAQQAARNATGLIERREVLRLALQGGRMGVFSWGVRDNRAWWSPELEHMLGLPAASLEPELDALMAFVCEEDRGALRTRLRECAQARSDCAVEFRLCNAQGETLWASLRSETEYDARGQPTSVFGVIGDITDRKRSEETAAEIEAQFQTLANEIPQIAWMSRPDGWIYWYNRRWYDYSGQKPEEAEG